MRLKAILTLCSLLLVAIIAFSLKILFEEKSQEKLQGDIISVKIDSSCVDLINSNNQLTQSQAFQAQDCLKMMIEEIQRGGYKIGNQGNENIVQTIDVKRIARYYQQRIKSISLDSSNKLIQKATDAQILEASVDK